VLPTILINDQEDFEMSMENVERFWKFLAANEEGLSKAKSFGGDVDALTAYARELGYDFSPEELREQRDKAQQLIKAKVEKQLQQSDVSLSHGAQEFYKLIKLGETDEEVSKRLSGFGVGMSKELIAYGKEKGFTFNEQDMLDAAKSMLEPSDEFSDEELEMAAGGTFLAVASLVVGVAGLVVGAAGLAVGVVSVVKD
jgi:predicted ribosomally synthesized peptide with nif11-like leader